MNNKQPSLARELIGRAIRQRRLSVGETLEQVSTSAGITYQYLSLLENGRENFTIGVLESVSGALQISLNELVNSAYRGAVEAAAPCVEEGFFRRAVPLPGGLTYKALAAAMNRTQEVFWMINKNMVAEVGRPLHELVQGNNFSGLVSNVFSDAMDQHTSFKHNDHQRYPDLICEKTGVGLEVKATIQVGKGGESHNGHSGWHTIVCFEITDQGIEFLHVMFGELIGHQEENADWNYVGSKVNEETGSRRTETYNTNLFGLTKLRDGSAFLNSEKIIYKRWRKARHGAVPSYSIFSA
jgi:transcriptional regulator with XRE-family HTH domain